MNQPSEQELIDLLYEKTPQDLSPEEIASLREAMKQNPAVREALTEEVGMEQAMATHYAPPAADTDRVFTDFSQLARSRKRREVRRLYGVAVVVLFVALALVTSRYWMPAEDEKDTTVAEGPTSGIEALDRSVGGSAPDPAAASRIVDPGGQNADRRSKLDTSRTPAAEAPTAPAMPLDARHYIDALTASPVSAPIDPPQILQPLAETTWHTKVDKGVGMKGAYKLAQPLRSDQMLRLSLGEYKPITLDLWRGKQGVRFEWRDHRWRGYQVTREDTKTLQPQTARLAMTDTMRGAMLGTMPFDLSLTDGQAVLSRAGIPLAAMAFEGRRADVVIRGSNRLFLAELRPAVDLAGGAPLASEPAEAASWEALPDKNISIKHDGGTQTTISTATGDGSPIAAMPLPHTDAFDVRFEVRNAPSGTTLELESGNGQRIGAPVRIAGSDDQRAISWGGPGAPEKDARSHKQWIGQSVWLRYIGRLDGVTCMASPNGRDWYVLGSAHDAHDQKPSEPGRVTLALPPSKEAQRVVVADATASQYTALDSLAQALRAQPVGDALPSERTERAFALIQQAIERSVDAEPIEFAIRELAWRLPINARDQWTPAVLDLTTHAVERELDLGRVDRAVALIDSAYVLHGPDALGQQRPPRLAPLRAQHALWYSLLSGNQWDALESSILKAHVIGIRANGEAFDWKAMRADRGDWWPRLSRAMLETARRHLDKPPLEFAGRPTELIEHPLTVRGDRETETLMAEFQAAVDAGQAAQACRLLVSGTLDHSLIAVGSDPDVLRSTSFLIRQAMRQSPQIQAELRTEHVPVGEVRVNRAIAAEDIGALQSLALQFHGTTPGIEAAVYLADRDLALGRFLAAAERYASLLDAGGGFDRKAMQAKHRLAWAMLGESRGQPINGSVRLGDNTFRGRDFEDMIHSLLEQNSPSASNHANIRKQAKGFKPGPVTQAGLLDLKSSAADGRLFTDGRQVIALTPGTLEAVDLQARTSRVLSDDKGRRPAEGATPLLLDDGFICRWGNGNKIGLRYFKKDGDTRWAVSPDAGVVSDPVRIGRWLFVLSRKQGLGRRTVINLNRIDLATGSVVQSSRLIELGATHALDAGRPTVTDAGLIFGVASTLIATDTTGEVQWVRRLPYIPESVDPMLWKKSNPTTTMAVQGDRLVVASQGSPDLLGIDLASGDVLWTRPSPYANQVLGILQDTATIYRDGGLMGISVETGQPQWRRDIASSQGARSVLTPRELVAVAFREDGQNTITWVSPRDGTVIQAEPLPGAAERRLLALTAGADQLLATELADDGRAKLVAIKPK